MMPSSHSSNPLGRRRLLVVAVAVPAMLAALGGYWLGAARGGTAEHVGTAYSTASQISVETEDWTYNVPVDVRWTDASGGWHEGKRPGCLPPTGKIQGVRFSAVPSNARGAETRQVVAVHCD